MSSGDINSMSPSIPAKVPPGSPVIKSLRMSGVPVDKIGYWREGDIGLFSKPRSLLTLGAIILGLIFTAFFHSPETIAEGYLRGFLAAAGVFIMVGCIILPDGAFVRPHPVFWRMVLAMSILYMLMLVVLLFLPAQGAREFFQWYDSSLGASPIQRTYAEDCSLYVPDSPVLFPNLLAAINDRFALAHLLGWAAKAILFRSASMLWFLSILWELMELTFARMLPNFQECWWDQVILDVIVCNGAGIVLGLWIAKKLEMRHYNWVGYRNLTSRGDRLKRVILQFSPESWTSVHWKVLSSPKRFMQVLFFILLVNMVEMNAFLIKYVLWVPAESLLNLYRLVLWSVMGAPATREFYYFVTSSDVKKIGAQAWVALAVISLEFMIVLKLGEPSWDVLNPWFTPFTKIAWGISLSVFFIGAALYFKFRPQIVQVIDEEQRKARDAKKNQ